MGLHHGFEASPPSGDEVVGLLEHLDITLGVGVGHRELFKLEVGAKLAGGEGKIVTNWLIKKKHFFHYLIEDARLGTKWKLSHWEMEAKPGEIIMDGRGQRIIMAASKKASQKIVGVGCQLTGNDAKVSIDVGDKGGWRDTESKPDRVVVDPYVTVGRGINYTPVPRGDDVGQRTEKNAHKG